MINLRYLDDYIFNELDRLGLSTNQDAFSGLMAVNQNVSPYSPEGNDIKVVKVYDDYSDGFYDGLKLLEFLKTLNVGDAVLSGGENSIWNLIEPCEV